MPPTPMLHQESAGSWSASWCNISGSGGPSNTWRRFNPAWSGDSRNHQSPWANSCSLAKSLCLQPSGPSHASPLFMQGAMASPVWSTFTQPPLHYDDLSPKSFDSSQKSEDHSPDWSGLIRRWAECSGFNILTDAVSIPLLRQHIHTDESRTAQRLPRISSAPSTNKPDSAPMPGGVSSTRDGREAAAHCTPATAQRTLQ